MFLNGPRKRLFTLLDTPVYASSSSLVLLALIFVFYGSGGAQNIVLAALVAVVAFVGILAHELGHAMAVRGLGHGRSEIVFGALGGGCIHRARMPRKHSVLVALAGPAVSLALAAAHFGAELALSSSLGGSGYLLSFLRIGALLNLIWGLFNLLPIFPLDGGRALRTYLGARMPERRAVRWSLKTSGIAGVLAILLAAWWNEIPAALLIAYLLLQNWQEWTSKYAR